MRYLTLKFWLGSLALLTLCRTALILWQWPRVADTGTWWQVLVGGWRMDLAMLAMISVVPAVLAPWLGHRVVATRITSWWYRIWWFLLVFLEVATPQFLLEYDSRPNRLFFEYLVHPREVAAMLWEGYTGTLLVSFVVLALAAWSAFKLFAVRNVDTRMPWWKRPIASVLMLAALVMGIRGTLDHRPINPSTVAYSSDAMVNTLPLNSLYSVLYAAYRLKDERSASGAYGGLPRAKVLEVVREVAGIEAAAADPSIPTLHFQTATHARERPLNLVIIVEESLGAQYVGSLGGKGLTPQLDALAEQGWAFQRAYATGTRSVRGLEALVTGFTPTPSEAVLKLSGSQSGFFTLAQLLDRHGYHARFLYGGEAHFDNMQGFFMGNGFEEVVDEADFRDPVFVGSWGASDEDMFNELHRLLSKPSDEPSFTLAFSVSNHSPWEYPSGRIAVDGNPATVENTVRYADWALGNFFEKARSSSYWDNTVFLVAADHDARVTGASLVPVERFHIPAVILGGAIEPRKDTRIVSQIDLPPTLLSLIGLSAAHPMIGHDLTRPGTGGRAMMQYGNNYGYLKGNDLIVLEPHKDVRQYAYERSKEMNAEPLDPALALEAHAMALWPEIAYTERGYRLP